MCFDVDSAPPIPPLAGAAVDHEDLVLTSADGTEFAGFLATPAAPSGAGIVILPDVRGLYGFYEELALRFAERGHTALAFDYFGRTAGVGKRGEDFEWQPHVQATTAAGVQDDIAASAAKLRGQGATTIVTVGFCFGGGRSWLAAAEQDDLAGAVGFYGRPGPMPLGDHPEGPIDRVADFRAPILALMGGADEGIPLSDIQAFERALEAAGADHEIVVYDGAPHSFFDRKQEQFAEASADAWDRTLRFIDERLA